MSEASGQTRKRLDIERTIALISCSIVAIYFASSCIFTLVSSNDYLSARPQLFRYFIVPGILSIAFLAIGIWFPKQVSSLVGVCGTAVLIALFAFEAYLTLREVPLHLGNVGVHENDERPAVPQQSHILLGAPLKSLNSYLEVADPSEAVVAGALPHSPTLLCIRDGRSIVYNADRYGFNNPDDVYELPSKLVVLGDSFIEGFCNPPGNDVVSRVREAIPGSLSIATRGNGPLLELAALGRMGPRLKPRYVIMAFFEGNDWRNFELELQHPWLQATLSPNADFGEAIVPTSVQERAREIIKSWERRDVTALDILLKPAALRNFIALQKTSSVLGLYYPKVPVQRPEYARVLRRAKEISDAWGGSFAILYIPQVGRYLGIVPNGFAFDTHRRPVLQAAKAVGVDVIDLVSVLSTVEDPKRSFANDGHFSDEGAKLAADAIIAYIERLRAKSTSACVTANGLC